MSIIKTISQSKFIEDFKTLRPDNFTYNGLIALYDHLDQLSEDINQNIEMDTIAICCEYSEYETAYEAMEQFQGDDMPIPLNPNEDMDLIELQEESKKMALEWLNDRTTVITFDGGIIIQNF